jgi:outer membrane receptor protein involved in Fe transport
MRYFVVLLFFGFVTSPGYSQDSVFIFNMDFEQILNIEIFSSNKKIENLVETPAVVNVITSEDIKMLGFSTLEQVIEYSVGLSSINGEGNIFTTTTIRGNTQVNYNTNTLLLFDGIPLYNAYHGSFDFQIIPLSSIDRIEIVKGSNSVLYGSNAVNGVINIISKKAGVDDNLVVSGLVRYGSYRSQNVRGSLMKKKGDLRFSVFADMNTSKGEVLPFNDEHGKALELQKSYKGISTAAKLSYQNLSLDVIYYNRNLPGVRTRNFHYVYTSLTNPDSLLKPELSDEYAYVVNLEYANNLSDKVKVNVRSNVMDWSLHKELFNGYWDYSSFGFYNDLYFTIKTNERFSNKIGVNYNHYLGRRFKSQHNEYDIGKNKIWTNDYAFYFNGEYNPVKSLKVYYGGRFYYAKYDETDFSNFSPRLALTYTPFKDIYLKAIFGQSFRIPTYFEKEVASKGVIGNPNLLPEKSTSYDLIISGVLKKLQYDIDMFYSTIKDRITRVQMPDNPDMQINMNVGEVSFKGVEINSKYRFGEKLYGFFGYSYNIGKDLDTDQRLKFTYKNMVNLGANVRVFNWMNLNSSAKFLDDWGSAASYFILNAGINVRPDNSIPLFINFKVDNIFDTDIYLPEIARESEVVPVIPKTFNRMFFIGLSYNL